MSKEAFASLVIANLKTKIGITPGAYTSGTPAIANQAIADAVTEYLIANTMVTAKYTGVLTSNSQADPVIMDTFKLTGKCAPPSGTTFDAWLDSLLKNINDGFTLATGAQQTAFTIKPFAAKVKPVTMADLTGIHTDNPESPQKPVWEHICGEILDCLNGAEAWNVASGTATRPVSKGTAQIVNIYVGDGLNGLPCSENIMGYWHDFDGTNPMKSDFTGLELNIVGSTWKYSNGSISKTDTSYKNYMWFGAACKTAFMVGYTTSKNGFVFCTAQNGNLYNGYIRWYTGGERIGSMYFINGVKSSYNNFNGTKAMIGGVVGKNITKSLNKTFIGSNYNATNYGMSLYDVKAILVFGELLTEAQCQEVTTWLNSVYKVY